ncbi:MAG: hypothetical protein K0Q96_240 [Rubrobacteraceae bacterium]|nr:hypothetical protein [Rubrobacteraceae bacterium]
MQDHQACSSLSHRLELHLARYLEGVFSDAPLLHPSMLANSDRIGEQVVCRLKPSRLVRL